ncbi:uncharacterized protein METZ01_LOCUS190341, partial [marine metagenome]
PSLCGCCSRHCNCNCSIQGVKRCYSPCSYRFRYAPCGNGLGGCHSRGRSPDGCEHRRERCEHPHYKYTV